MPLSAGGGEPFSLSGLTSIVSPAGSEPTDEDEVEPGAGAGTTVDEPERGKPGSVKAGSTVVTLRPRNNRGRLSPHDEQFDLQPSSPETVIASATMNNRAARIEPRGRGEPRPSLYQRFPNIECLSRLTSRRAEAETCSYRPNRSIVSIHSDNGNTYRASLTTRSGTPPFKLRCERRRSPNAAIVTDVGSVTIASIDRTESARSAARLADVKSNGDESIATAAGNVPRRRLQARLLDRGLGPSMNPRRRARINPHVCRLGTAKSRSRWLSKVDPPCKLIR